MSSAGDALSLGKLGRAVRHSSDYTTTTALAGDCRGSASETSLSMFDAGTVASMTLDPDQTNEGTTTGTMNFTSPGSLFISKVAGLAQNFTWSESGDTYSLISIASNQDYTATITVASDFPLGPTSLTITGKFYEDGQSDGFNDHVSGYNTNKSDTFTYDNPG